MARQVNPAKNVVHTTRTQKVRHNAGPHPPDGVPHNIIATLAIAVVVIAGFVIAAWAFVGLFAAIVVGAVLGLSLTFGLNRTAAAERRTDPNQPTL
ncbi:MAG TPA: hypothetical protein PLF40_25015 [Kofleriaceae bacterium]|nr:hypothetical protein [Kofleriaceae bacterium]